MPSPFPGMDPFLEGQVWTGFHSQFIAELQRILAPLVRPAYVTFIEEHLYLLREPGAERGVTQPDALVVEWTGRRAAGGKSENVAVIEPPAILPLPQLDVHRQVYLEVRRANTGRVVTVIELLSPVNKSPGPGLSEYLRKRAGILFSAAHLVEIDLLRGGHRPPMGEDRPPGDFHVIVSRAEERPGCGVWSVSLHQRLPLVPVPLLEGDPDVGLDLQQVFERVYDAAEYAFSLDYEHGTEPPLSPQEQSWAQGRLAGRSG